MVHNGVEFTVKIVKPGIWKYRFQIGRSIKSGRTKAALELLAIQRVQKRIDRALTVDANPVNLPVGGKRIRFEA
jgi:hypothetical protein